MSINNFNYISIVIILLLKTTFAFSQLRIDSKGDTYVKYGTFCPGNDAVLFLGDHNHYIKSKFGYGVLIGTGGEDILKLPQWSGRVGILMEPKYTLDVNGIVRAKNFYFSVGEESLINNTANLSNKSNELLKVKGVSYDYSITGMKELKNNELNNTIHFGFNARDLQKIFPELVYQDKEGNFAIDYNSFIPLLVEAVKNQAKRIDELESIIKTNYNTNNNKNEFGAYLKQSSPNPFRSITKVDCFVPINSKYAAIYIYDIQGVLRKTIELQGKGVQSIIINKVKGGFKTGIYLYKLIIDNKLIDSKQMVTVD